MRAYAFMCVSVFVCLCTCMSQCEYAMCEQHTAQMSNLKILHLHNCTRTPTHFYTYPFTLSHVHVHIHTFTHTRSHLHTYSYTLLCLPFHTFAHTRTHSHFHTYTFTFAHVLLHTFMLTLSHFYTYPFTLSHFYTYPFTLSHVICFGTTCKSIHPFRRSSMHWSDMLALNDPSLLACRNHFISCTLATTCQTLLNMSNMSISL
jgi:hypothetical protein